MDAKVRRGEHFCVISYEGDTTGLMPGPLPEVLQALNEGTREIILEFSGLKYLNPNGIKALRDTLEAAKVRDANIGIAAPPAHVRRALRIGGLVPAIPIYHSEREAISKLDMVDYRDEAAVESTDRLLVCQKQLPLVSSLRDALKEHSLKPHFRMKPCRDLARAMEIILKERIDCIIIDGGFPLYQVTDLIEKVETDPRLPSIPILVVATDDKLLEAELMVRNGAHEILRYPFRPVEVVVRLLTLISHLKDHRPYVPPESGVQPRGWKA